MALSRRCLEGPITPSRSGGSPKARVRNSAPARTSSVTMTC